MKHTKGKWTAITHPRAIVKHGRHKGEPCGVQHTLIKTDADTNKNHICNISGFDNKGSGWTSRKEAIANANLIAAAPELLRTIKPLIARIKAMDSWAKDYDQVKEAEEAIAKAEGK